LREMVAERSTAEARADDVMGASRRFRAAAR
jgi:hypothetical protein